MQKEILAANPGSRIRILAVNDAGHESGVPSAVGADRTLPLLQDAPEVSAWTLWGVAYRDVVVLDGENRPLGVFNLTERSLDHRPEYDVLLDALRIAAGE
jgi:hypothetical protein